MKNRSIVIISTLLNISFFSCKNKYEIKLVGIYAIDSCEGVSLKKVDASSLQLYSNKVFKITYSKHKKVYGHWEAGDDGDRTWVNFKFKKYETDGVVGGDSLNFIDISNSGVFRYPNLKCLTYKKLYKHQQSF